MFLSNYADIKLKAEKMHEHEARHATRLIK